MLYDFLLNNQEEILASTENKTLELAGDHLSSARLKQGLPIFYQQIVSIIQNAEKPAAPPEKKIDTIAMAADCCNEPAMALAAGRPEDAELAKCSGLHGTEMLRLGYTLSHVVHAYGALCQAITETASKKRTAISADEFNALNRCLDVAIAGAVTAFQSDRDTERLEQGARVNGFLMNEMRSVLLSASTAFRSIQQGSVGASGFTGHLVLTSLERLGELIDRSEDGLASH